MFGRKVNPLPQASVQAAEALVNANSQRVEPAQVSVGGGSGAVEADVAVSAAVSNAIAAERQRLADIAKAAYKGQEKLAMELMVSGKSELEAVKAFNADFHSKAEAAPQEQKPEITKEELIDSLLAKYKEGIPEVPSTSAQSEPNVYDQYKAIENPAQRQAFYAAHKAEIDEIANSLKTKKEG
jgi:DNA polymerase III gamma/tau subunit